VGNISWTNNTSQALHLSWVTISGDEVPFLTLAAGDTSVQGPAYFGGVNLVRDSDGDIVFFNIVNGNENSSIVISQDDLNAQKSAGLKTVSSLKSLKSGTSSPNYNVQNSSSVTLTLNWIDQNGVPNTFDEIPAGRNVVVGPTEFGRVITLNNENGVVTVFVTSAAESQTFLANDKMINFWS